jgi:flagellar biosynthesis protein FlhB
MEKTEEASERRIQQFREEGKVATSKELVSAVGVLAGGGTLFATLPQMGSAVRTVMDAMRARLADGDLAVNDVTGIFATIAMTVGPILVLVLATATVAMALAGTTITGFNIAPGALQPKPERLNPLSNFQNQYFSWQPWVQLLKGLAVAALIAWAAWGCVSTHVDAIPALGRLGSRGQAMFLADLAGDFARRVGPVVLLIGVADFAWQRFRLAREMRMTKEEVKQEHKEQEGDPKIKARRRQRARQIAMQQMLPRVKEADVVIANPTHYAIAIRYRKDENRAPVVLARGVDHLALKIRAEAAKHEVPVIENRPLARALYAASKLGLPIPAEFFGPVAQVLATVYRGRMQRRPNPA